MAEKVYLDDNGNPLKATGQYLDAEGNLQSIPPPTSGETLPPAAGEPRPPVVRRGHEAEDAAGWARLQERGAQDFTTDPSMMVGPGAINLVRGVLKGAAPAAQKAMMLTKALGVPMVKYELAKHGLTAMGVPAPIAEMAAAGVSGYRRGAKAPGVAIAEAAPVAATMPAAVAEAPLAPAAQSLATRTGTEMQTGAPMPRGPIRTAPAPPAAAPVATPARVPPPPAAAEPPWRQPPPENAQAIRDAIARNRGGTSAGPSPASPGASSGPGEAIPASPQVVDMPQGPPLKASQAQAAVKAAARAAGIKLTPGEARDVTHLVEAGHDAETVVKLVPQARGEIAAAELARRLGTPTHAQVWSEKPWNRAGMAQPEP